MIGNASVHPNDIVKELIEKTGAILFYGPHCSPHIKMYNILVYI